MAAPLKVAIAGLGTVGTAVLDLIQTQRETLAVRCSRAIEVVAVCARSRSKKRGAAIKKLRWVDDPVRLASDREIDVFVELIGGEGEPARSAVATALAHGKSVVTANKALLARHGVGLAALAEKHHVALNFEAAVGGAIPIVKTLREGLAGNSLARVYGILNGTCNYILSQIETRGISFDVALSEAQKLGFAEADPTDDVDGYDARAKLAILARVGLRCDVHPTKIVARSISPIEAVDFDHAKQLQCTIRQVSWAQLQGDSLMAAVQPSLVGFASPLARVAGSQNLVMSTGKFGGETVFAGHGAGGHPTAVAVVSDLVAISRARSGMPAALAEDAKLTPNVNADFTSRHYVRFTVKDRPGIIASLAAIFAGCGINLDSVLQKPGYDKTHLPFVITLEPCKASLVENAMQQIAKLDFLVKPCLHLPMLD
jgi:homoserine dehydrogenase